MSFPSRGEIYWVRLDPTVGTEISKTRPGLIVSNDVGNEHSSRVTVAPLTSRGVGRAFPFEVLLPAGEGGVERLSKVLANQVRTIDKRRLGDRIGILHAGRMVEVDGAIRVALGV